MRVGLEELNALARRYREAADGVRVEAYRTPLNRAEEAERVEDAYRRRVHYEPRFEYRDVPDGLEDPLAALRDEAPDGEWGALVASTCDYVVRSLQALRRRDGQELTEVSSSWFGHGDDEVLARARAVLERPSHDGCGRAGGTVGAGALAAVFGRALTLLGAQGWSVELDAEMSARVSVAPRARRIRIRTDARFAPAELRRLTVHEVGCHVARYENARRQPLELLALGLGRYLATEEGLAVWCERHFGAMGAGDERRYAARLVAVDLALVGSFSQVYGALRDVLPAPEAYDLCVRVRRGIADQSGAGAYVKDRVYLEGCAAVDRYLAERPQDLPLLLGAKVGLGELDALRRLRAAGCWADPVAFPEAVGGRPA